VVRTFGWKRFYGDVSRLDLLRAAGAETAKLLVLAIDDMDAAKRTIDLVRRHFPHLKMVVRAESRLNAYEFIRLQVPNVRLTWSPGLDMARLALQELGTPAHEAHVITQRFDLYDRKNLPIQAQHLGNREKLISISQESREELARIMEADDRRRVENPADGW
jgi:voltage-gated potassium channel Kch